MNSEIKIIITDDKKEYRKIFKELLEPYPVKVIAEAENGKVLVDLLSDVIPDVVLLDIEMDVMDGSKAYEIIRQRFPQTKVIMLSMHFNEILVENFIERGVKGYLSKDSVCGDNELLYRALFEVNAGGIFVIKKNKWSAVFSKKQKEILSKVIHNKTNKAIASELGVSTRAIEKQRKTIYQRIGAKNSQDFYKYVFSRGYQYIIDLFNKKQ